ncbi:MAG: VWA domain-containing protein [Planctomycetes bacterium]|nr:VWA domain-containing protein [Planctomycetota bacterium]
MQWKALVLALAASWWTVLGARLDAAQAPNPRPELEVIADASVGGEQRAQAIRSFMARAKEQGECAGAAAELDAIILDQRFPAWLRRVGAEAIASCGDERTAAYLAARMGRGTTRERLHHLRGARGSAHAKVFEAALALLRDDDPRVRCEAAELLARHKVEAAHDTLADVVAKGRDEELLESALHAAGAIVKGSEREGAWRARLEQWANEKSGLRRRAALGSLFERNDAALRKLAERALADDDWSVRVLALEWLAREPSVATLELFIARLEVEAVGSRVHGDLNDKLEAFTGVKRYTTHEQWVRWRAGAGRDWAPGKKEGDPASAGGEPRSRTRPKFYGVDVVSARTLYVIDLSGSMNAQSKSPEHKGKRRIDVAKEELLALIDSLPPGSWFNIVAFGDNVFTWLESLASFGVGRKGSNTAEELTARQRKRDEELREKARSHVRSLNLSGSTNIYDAFARAFEDPDVDTICFMTDGTPTTGTETEAVAIREELVRWNRTRCVRIHCVAVGEDNSLPRWIAADHGGVHRFVP